jgi:hypothetical protein
VPTIDIDRDAAHQAAQSELAKPIYPKASWLDQLNSWISELLYRLARASASVPGGWFTIAVLLVILAVAVVVGVRVARRTMRTNRGGAYSLFGEQSLSAAEHRATAEQGASSGDWAAAIRHRLRAVARQLEETAVLDPVPGRTATELARDAGQQLPGFAAGLSEAATLFNDVSYGERPGTQPAYRIIADLDDRLELHAPAAAGVPGAAPIPDVWANVR